MPQSYVTEPTSYEGKMTAVRIDAKTRYLSDVARAITGESFTRYLERSLEESHSKVTLRIPAQPEMIFDETTGKWTLEEVDQEEERFANAHMSIANQAMLLWSDSEYLRLLMLHKVAPHIVSDDDAALLNYIENRKDLRVQMDRGYKLDREKIIRDWDDIKTVFAKTKGKGK